MTEKAYGSPEDLLVGIRMAQSIGKKRILATREVFEFFQPGSTGPDFYMNAIQVVEVGREKEADVNQTMEQVNFGKR